MDDNEDNEKVVDEKPVRNILFCTLHFTCYEKPHPITLIIVLYFFSLELTAYEKLVKKTTTQLHYLVLHQSLTILFCLFVWPLRVNY